MLLQKPSRKLGPLCVVFGVAFSHNEYESSQLVKARGVRTKSLQVMKIQLKG
jgi:hypothetical protein